MRARAKSHERSRRHARAGLLLACAFGATVARNAGAQNPPPIYSEYEIDSIRAGLTAVGAQIDDNPQGKIIERVEVIPLDVIEQRDPVPGKVASFLNWFHARTRPLILAQEVLQNVGDTYDRALIDETCRNLRGQVQLSLVLCLPVKSERQGRVAVLIIAKDVWSLRLNTNFQIADGKLESLVLQPTETNIQGRHHILAINTDLELYTFSLGAGYTDPRFFGSWITGSASANVILNRATGNPEGSFGTLQWGQPLYSTRTEWAWLGKVAWTTQIYRRLVGGGLASFDATSTPQEDFVPWVYYSNILQGAYVVTRSFGVDVKHNFDLGMAAQQALYSIPSYTVPPFTPPGTLSRAAIDEFVRTEVPVSDTQIGPYVQYHSYRNRFMSVLDLNTLGLQEDVQLGHDFYLRFQPVTKALQSTRNFVGLYSGAAYTWALGDGIARVYAQTNVDLTGPSGTAQAPIPAFPDASFSSGFRIETPRTPIGRLIVDSVLVDRPNDYLNSQSTLGGDTRLRGYPSGQFIGHDLFAANVEFRSRLFELLTAQVGAVAFFDVGDAFDTWNTIFLKRGAGIGWRLVLPQLNRAVIRVDWGVPLTANACTQCTLPGNLVVTFDQAFGMPALSP